MTNIFSRRYETMRAGPMGKLWVLMFAAFVDMVGALMVIPILPFYAKHLGASATSLQLIVASFSAAQLLSAPLWGRVSDRYGRKPMLLIGLSASVVSYVLFAFAGTIWMLLLSRIIQGAGGGTVGVIQAYVADAVEPKNRAKGLGWLSAATNVGVVIGPVIGSYATYMGRPGPGLTAAVLCVLNMYFVYRYLPESHGQAARDKSRTARSPLDLVLRVLVHPRDQASRLIWIYALAIGAFYSVNPLIVLLLGQRFGVTERTIGFYFLYIGFLNVVFRVGLLGRVIDRIGEVRSARLGALFLATGLATVPLTHHFPLLLLCTGLLPLGASLTFPAVTGLLSQAVGDHERGSYMGVQQTYGGIIRSGYPYIAGRLWDAYGVGMPFFTSAGLVASTVLMTFGVQQRPRTAELPARKAAAAEQGAEEQAEKPQAAR